jgi:hypothetical protein
MKADTREPFREGDSEIALSGAGCGCDLRANQCDD